MAFGRYKAMTSIMPANSHPATVLQTDGEGAGPRRGFVSVSSFAGLNIIIWANL